jgi:FAD/FMN-containing dehydrogenase
MAKVPEGATAFPQRSSHFTMNVHTRWSDPSRDADCIAWARRLSERVAPHDAGSVYVNFLTEEETGRLGGAYGDNLSRLREVKARRDPDNFFRLNHNIAPKASVEPAE